MLHSTNRTLIIGVGNPDRGDDRIGLEVSTAIQNLSIPGIQVDQHVGDGYSLMARWKGFSRVILVDCVSSDSAPGTLHRVDASKDSLPSGFFRCSTHNFGILEAVEMAKALKQLPERFIIIGIEGSQFSHGAPISAEVAASQEKAVELIKKEIQRGD